MGNGKQRQKKMRNGQRSTNNATFSSTFNSSNNSLLSLPFANTTGSLGIKKERNPRNKDILAKGKKLNGSRVGQLQQNGSHDIDANSGYSDSSAQGKDHAPIAKKRIPSTDRQEEEMTKIDHVSMNTKPNDVQIEKRTKSIMNVRALNTIEGIGIILFINGVIFLSHVSPPESFTALLIVANLVLLNITL